MLLILSVAARLAWTYLAPNGANFVDLHVYLGGAAAIDHPGTLYSYVYADQTPDFPLPFTYPPFAAVVFYPLHLLPFGLVAFLWQVATVAALYGAVRISQRLVGAGSHRTAMLWTAISIWIEPLRSTFDYGQINVLLMLAVLWAAYSTRWWVSGLLVGVAAGIKLTPAIAGVYLLGVRRFGAAVLSAVVFAATIAVSVLVVGDQTRYYFTELLGDAHRVGPIATSFNQSWRGGISRILGHDAGFGPLVAGGDRCHSGAGDAGLAGAGRVRSARQVVGGRTVRAVVLADFVDSSLGVAGAADDLADSWSSARASGRADFRLGLVGAHHYRRALVAQLCATDHLADRPALVPGLGGPGVHRRGVGHSQLDCGQRATCRPVARLVGHDPVDIARHVDVVLGDTTLGMRNQRESHCPPTDIDIGVMISALRMLGHPAYRIDAREEARKFDRPSYSAVGALPAVELGQCGVHLFIR